MARWVGKFRSFYAIALMMFAGFYLQACAGTSSYVQESRHLASSGDWDRSAQVLQKAHEEHPADLEINLLLKAAQSNASLQHMTKGEALMNQGLYDEALKELQMSIAFDPGNARAEVLIQKTRHLRESDFLFRQGQALLKAQKYLQAREAFKKAVTLNPNNADARKALAAYRKEVKRPPRFRLKLKSVAPVSLKFKMTPITNVFEILSKLTDINFIFDKDVQDTKVTLFMTDVPIERFIEVLLETNNLAGKLVDSRTMIIYPNTPNKIREYQDLEIRTFYLSHLKVKDAVALLTKILKAKDVIANEKLNALVIRGPKSMIDLASKILEANDRAPAEVLLNVEMLEVSRSKERELGLDLSPSAITFGIGESSPQVSADSVYAPNVSMYALDRLSNKELLLSIPVATLNLLKQDADTKTLANPQIRVNNGETANIHVGDRVPLQVNRRIDTTGAITNDYQYQDIGVKVMAQPTVNLNDEVSLKLKLEVSALGPNLGTADNPEYDIRTRTADSVLTIRDGEPVIIGGLISDDETKTTRKIPLLGDLPGIGRLFTNVNSSKTQQDIIMTITPIIVRSQDIPGKAVSQIWSGQDQDFSLREPYASYAESQNMYYSRPKNAKAFAGQPLPGNLEGGVSGPNAKNPPEMGPKPQEESHSPRPSIPPLPPPGKALQPPVGQGQMKASVRGPGPLKEQAKTPVHKEKKADQSSLTSENHEYFWPAAVRYSIHVDSYSKRQEALERVKNLSREKYDCFLVPVDIPGMGSFFRVFVGSFGDYRSASTECAALKRKKGFAKDIHVVDRRWAFGG